MDTTEQVTLEPHPQMLFVRQDETPEGPTFVASTNREQLVKRDGVTVIATYDLRDSITRAFEMKAVQTKMP